MSILNAEEILVPTYTFLVFVAVILITGISLILCLSFFPRLEKAVRRIFVVWVAAFVCGIIALSIAGEMFEPSGRYRYEVLIHEDYYKRVEEEFDIVDIRGRIFTIKSKNRKPTDIYGDIPEDIPKHLNVEMDYEWD